MVVFNLSVNVGISDFAVVLVTSAGKHDILQLLPVLSREC
jgi:hypothetical protein